MAISATRAMYLSLTHRKPALRFRLRPSADTLQHGSRLGNAGKPHEEDEILGYCRARLPRNRFGRRLANLYLSRPATSVLGLLSAGERSTRHCAARIIGVLVNVDDRIAHAVVDFDFRTCRTGDRLGPASQAAGCKLDPYRHESVIRLCRCAGRMSGGSANRL